MIKARGFKAEVWLRAQMLPAGFGFQYGQLLHYCFVLFRKQLRGAYEKNKSKGRAEPPCCCGRRKSIAI
jgi:hypothetical protein